MCDLLTYESDTTSDDHPKSGNAVEGSGTSCVGNWRSSGGRSRNDTGAGNGRRGNTSSGGNGGNGGGRWAGVDGDSSGLVSKIQSIELWAYSLGGNSDGSQSGEKSDDGELHLEGW